MNTHLLHYVLKQFRVSFLAFFSALTKQDHRTLLEEQGETLLHLLQQRYGYTRSQAKVAWNEFVLRYVDGHNRTYSIGFSFGGAPVDCLSPSRQSAQDCWWLHYKGKGVLTEGRDLLAPVYH